MNRLLQTLENASERLARMMTSTGVSVVFTPKVSGPMADVERQVILMPPLPEKLTEGELDYLHGALDHEAAHILFTKGVDGKGSHKSEGFRGMIENALEDGRINRAMETKYLGSADNLARLYKRSAVLAEEAIAKGELDPTSESYKVVEALLKISMRHVWKRPELVKYAGNSADDLVATLPEALRRELEAIETVGDVTTAAPKVEAWLRSEHQKNQPKVESKPDAEPQKGDKGGEGGQSGKGKGKGKVKAEKSERADEADEAAGDEAGGDEAGEDEGRGAAGEGGDEGSKEPRDEGEGDEGSDGADEGDESAAGTDEASGSGDEAGDDEMDTASESTDAEGGDGDDADGGAGKREMGEEGGKLQRLGGENGAHIQGIESVGGIEVAEDAVFEAEVVKISETISEAIRRGALPVFDGKLKRGAYLADTSKDVVEHINKVYDDDCRVDASVERAMRKWATDIFSDYTKHVGSLRARLVMDLQARGKAWTRDLRSGRVLDTAALHRPRTGDARVFKHKRPKDEIDTAVMLVVDCSGSMRGSKLTSALQLAALFTDALEMANVPCEVVGFTTGSSRSTDFGVRAEPLRHFIFKGWNERLQTHMRKWVAVINHCANNVDGESVMWAAKRLAQRKEERKILLVLSDGMPCAAVRGPDVNLHGHLVEQVKKIEAAGIEALGIGIESNAVKHFYSKKVVYNSLADLMTGFYRTISELLRTGELRTHAA